jgi:chemotaxis protein CheD
MTASNTIAAGSETMLGMGQARAVRAPDRLWSILGSCVAVVLYDAHGQVGAMSHVVLPSASGRNGVPGKYADTAVPHMLQLLHDMHVPRSGLVAKLAGGAKMFGRPSPLEIGEGNIDAAIAALGAIGIRIAARDVGGTHGRRVVLNCCDGSLRVESLGRPPVIL